MNEAFGDALKYRQIRALLKDQGFQVPVAFEATLQSVREQNDSILEQWLLAQNQRQFEDLLRLHWQDT